MPNPFEELERQIQDLKAGQEAIKNLIQASSGNTLEIEKPMSSAEAIDFLEISAPTLYKMNNKPGFPAHRKFGKFFYFKSELVAYLKSDDE